MYDRIPEKAQEWQILVIVEETFSQEIVQK